MPSVMGPLPLAAFAGAPPEGISQEALVVHASYSGRIASAMLAILLEICASLQGAVPWGINILSEGF